ncbi:MAG: asparagine synthase (glutamine-hydrolyzing), partial [Planctomycetes bacterium]|nr:asparagine synthase (glutamine-hydrolyzing) [Planctomycetota bacterium]
MCGICGIVAPPGAVAPVEIVQRMVRALAHRGPDEQATHTAGRVAVGHTRLSIIDLAASKQPMVDDQRGMVLVFNGEIYNYKELREELRASGHVFTTAGDTEVVLRAYQVFGADCVTRLQGMFAFVIVSEEGRRIFAARDRLGIKPLFYALGDDGRFSFASELSALFEDASLSRVMDREAFAYFFTFGYCPDPLTLVAAARQLPPAHVLSIRDGRGAMRRYWSFVIGGRGGGRRRGEATARFRDLVEEAVRAHLVADVPVGSFLSSGLDSSLVTTLAARAAGQPIRTFTVGVRSEEGDERPFA